MEYTPDLVLNSPYDSQALYKRNGVENWQLIRIPPTPLQKHPLAYSFPFWFAF